MNKSTNDKIDEILIDLAYKSNHLSERYEFEESILHKGTHLSNAKSQIKALLNNAVLGEEIATLEWVLTQCSFTDGESDLKYIEDRLIELKQNIKGVK